MTTIDLFRSTQILYETGTPSVNQYVKLNTLQSSMTFIGSQTSTNVSVRNSGLFSSILELGSTNTSIIMESKNVKLVPSTINSVTSSITGSSLCISPQTISQLTGTNTEYSFNSFAISFVSATGGSVSKASTVFIEGAPIGSAATNYALEVKSGTSYFGGPVSFTTIIGGAGGSNTQIQYNNNGSFAGSSNLTWTSSTNTLNVSGLINATSATVAYANINNLSVSTLNISGYLNVNSATIGSLSSTTLYVSGQSTFNTINATSLTANQINVTTLNVSGTSSFTGLVTANTAVIGSLNVTTLNVSGPSSFTGLMTANTAIIGSLSVTTLNVTGPFTFLGPISANTAIVNQLSVSTLNVSGPSSFTGLVTANTAIIGSLSSTTLNVSGPSSFTGVITANTAIISQISATTLNVSGPTTLSGTVSATSITASGINVNGYVYDKNSWKTSVICATTGAVVLTSLGVGSVVDSIALSGGDRVLIKDQVITSENGIYDIQVGTAPKRSSDALFGFPADGSGIYVSTGLLNTNTLWFCDSATSYGSPITFSQFSISAVPGGPNQSVQFNNTGVFDGSSNLLWDNTNQLLYVNNNIQVGTVDNIGTISATTLYVAHDPVSEIQTAIMNSWTSITQDYSFFSAKSSCWSPELELFVAINGSSLILELNEYIIISNDGITWTTVNVATAMTFNDITWSSKLEKFVVIASNSLVMNSSDAIIWTTARATTYKQWTSIVWSSEKELFVACGYNLSGDYDNVMYSSDGITWTSSQSIISDIIWNDITYSNELGLFVAVGYDFISSNSIMKSSDAITWTSSSATTQANWTCITWSDELSQFVMCGESDDGYNLQLISISNDAINWTSASIFEVQKRLETICWSPQLSLYVVGTASLSGSYFLYSSNGINWTTTDEILSQYITSITWSPSLLRFIATNDWVSPDKIIYTDASYLLPFNDTTILGTRPSSVTDVEGSIVNVGNSSNIVNVGLYSNYVNIGGNLTVNGIVNISDGVFMNGLPVGSGNALAITADNKLVRTVSLRRYKYNEQELDTNDAYDVLKLEPKYFTWKNNKIRDLGLIVEDAVELGLDKYLYYDKEGPKNYKDRALIAALIKVFKDQDLRIKELESRINI